MTHAECRKRALDALYPDYDAANDLVISEWLHSGTFIGVWRELEHAAQLERVSWAIFSAANSGGRHV